MLSPLFKSIKLLYCCHKNMGENFYHIARVKILRSIFRAFPLVLET